jgi:hypothetical protein
MLQWNIDPFNGILNPLHIALWITTHGILTPHPTHRTSNPHFFLNCELSNTAMDYLPPSHGILNPLHIVLWTHTYWNFDPPTYPCHIKLPLVLGSESSNGMLTSSHCILNLILMVYRTLLPMCSWLSTHRKPNPLDSCLKFRVKKILLRNIDPSNGILNLLPIALWTPWYFEPITYPWDIKLPHILNSESNKTVMECWYPL